MTFSVTWRLLNGQHRLMAIVESGVAAETLVWTGIDDDAMLTTDIKLGGVRSPAEAWCISNGRAPQRNLIALVNACYAGLMGEMPRDEFEYGRAHMAFEDGADALAPMFASHRLKLGRASIAAGFVIAWKKYPADTIVAADSYFSGTGLSKGDPMLVLRDWAFSNRSGGGTHQRVAETRKALSLVLSCARGERRTQPRGEGQSKDIDQMIKVHGLEASR